MMLVAPVAHRAYSGGPLVHEGRGAALKQMRKAREMQKRSVFGYADRRRWIGRKRFLESERDS